MRTNPTESRKIVIRWRTRDEAVIANLRKQFRLPSYTTLNGWTPGEVNPEDMAVFESCVRLGYFTYMEKEWTYNGVTYSWKCQ